MQTRGQGSKTSIRLNLQTVLFNTPKKTPIKHVFLSLAGAKDYQFLRTTEADVARAVWRAANDETGQLRFPAGADAVALAQSR